MANKKIESKIYYSVSKGFRLGADKIQPETRYNDGRVETPAHVIQFFNHVFQTSDPREMEIIENCQQFKQGLIHIMSQKQLETKLAADAMLDGKTAQEAFGEKAELPEDALGYEDPGKSGD